ncbi:hypothetical protein BH09BAC3_BH09BAC3_20230 [soil metagenome]
MALKGKVWIGILVCLAAIWTESSAQFSNEWINFTQAYYKIPVAKNGIYKISYADLQAAGVPIGTIDPRKINLFHRGAEQAIFIQGQGDAIFDPSDFIEFYGQRNDGTLDADLYKPSSLQPHPFYNLYNDTTAYFLTWNALPIPGKRMNLFFETNSSSLPKETLHTEERLIVYSTEYAAGFTVLGEIQNTAFDQGEGWSGTTICKGLSGCTGQQDLIIDKLVRPITSSALPNLEVLLTGRDAVSHQAEIYAGPTGGSLRLVGLQTFASYETSRLNVNLNWSDIAPDGRMTVSVRLISSSRDQLSVSYVKVSFPQNFDAAASDKIFSLAPNAQPKSYVEILNPQAGARVWDISDRNNVGMIGTTSVAGGFGSVLPTGSKIFVSGTTISPALKKTKFRSFVPSQSNYIIISHRSLMKPASGYGDVIQSYAAYRASTIGGGYDTLTVAVDQLYNQFNYGETSPRAIYQFMKYLVNGGSPKFLFLIGKGLEVSKGFWRKTSIPPTEFRDLVPSAGMPAGDMAFTAGLNGTTYEPAVPTGRLTANTPFQVAAYLNKVKETDALPFNALWRKDLLHLSGGINVGEPTVFRSYVDGFKAKAESNFLGGKVETISKQTLNVEQINVKDQVNKGVELITFFGHSGPGTIDIDIGYVTDPQFGYNNAGKYPSFLINGCNAGRFFENNYVTFGEDWILAANKGAKSFIAHSSYGFTNTLRLYSDIFYSVAFGDSTFMRKGIAEVQKETGRRYLASSGGDITSTTQVQQMMLLGDPAVPLFAAAKPDYEINSGSISIVPLDGNPVTAKSDSFAIDVRIRNFGRAQPGTLEIKIERKLSDNSVIVYDSVINATLYSDIVRFKIRRGRTTAELGNNNFAVTIDPTNLINELSETNNSSALSFFIPLNGTKNLFPEPYAIVNSGTVQLVFQNTDLLATSRTFSIEIDTAATFDSPFLNRKTISGKVIAKMPLTLLTQDSLVYYWRTRLQNPTAGESNEWALTSFAYIKNSPEGWAQIKFPQYSENITTSLVSDPEIKRLKFLETVSSIDITTFGSANPTPFSQVSLKINQEEFNVASQEAPCRINTLGLIAFDKSSAAPYAGIPFPSFFDPRACGRAPQMINNFSSSEVDTGNGDDLAQWVANVRASDSVVLFSIGDARLAQWTTNAKQQLIAVGVATSQLNALAPGEPFIIFGKKGAAPGTAKIFKTSLSPPNAQQVSVSKTITGRFSNGSFRSVTIGPAKQWIKMTSQITEATPADQYGIDVHGINQAGQEVILKTNIKGSSDFSDINASLYPYIGLVLKSSDPVDLTSVQLKKWLVTFLPVPEGLLTYSGSSQQETLQEGQPWSAVYGFTNISSRNFTDSLTVQVDVFSSDRRSTERQVFRINPPAPGDTTKFPVSVKTSGKAGINDVTVFVNPRVLPELYYDNNILALYSHLAVERDTRAPLLDVTIDGRQVINGDVVSSSPLIVAKVVDRNSFLLKTDTTGINLYLQYPCALQNCPFKRINFSQSNVSWKPATATTDFQISFKPEQLAGGEYSLRAEAMDASGNRSGTTPYEVLFVVTEKKGFVLQSVYPNPSSDKFSFKLLLSGSELPGDFQLILYSTTGAVVRNYGSASLGVLHVGINDVSINVSNSQGESLPDGIYFFRILTTIGGTQFTKSGKIVVAK